MVGGFSYNGTHCSAYEILVRRINRPIKPEKRVKQQRIPGKHGTYDVTDNTFNNLTIAIDCVVKKPTGQTTDSLLHTIAAWLNRAGDLELDDDPGRFYRATAWSNIETERFFTVSEFAVIFDCFPLSQSAPHQLDVEITESGQTVDVVTTGNFETPCVINITNTGQTPISNIILEYRKEL